MYVAIKVLLCFCFVMILLLIQSQLCISWCTYIMYNIKIIYAYKIRFSQQNMHTITVDFPQMNI